MRMGIGLGVGINRSNYAQGIFNAYSARVVADGGVVESGTCVDAVSSLLQSASLLLIPSGYKGGKLYAEIPTNGNGDLTWTRGSDAFRTNASGVLQRMPWNVLTFSETFTNAIWQKSGATITANTTIAPNGTMTASSLMETTATTIDHYIFNASLGSWNNSMTYSVYLKQNGRRYAQTATVTSQGVFRPVFDLQDGVYVGNVGTNTGATASIENVGNGWFRCIVVHPSITLNLSQVTVIVQNSATYQSYTGDTTKGVFIWGAQLVEGTTAQTYLPTTDRLNFPRLSYMYGSCPSALLEPQRTNLILQSQDFDNASWGKTRSSVTANATTSPDGTSNADTFAGNGVSGNHYLNITSGFATTSGVSYTISIFAKKNTNNFLQIDVSGAAFGSDAYGNFDLNSGVVGSIGSGVNATITNVGNGWYRCTITKSAAITSTAALYLALITASNSPTFETNTLSTSVYLWGAQAEQGAYPTTYIPTTSATATRVADSAVKTGISSLIGQTEGVIYCDVYLDVRQTFSYLAIAPNITLAATYIGIGFNATSIQYEVVNSGVQSQITFANSSTGRFKIAAAYKQNDFVLYVNGTQIGTDTSGTVPTCSEIGLFAYNQNQPMRYNQVALFNTRLTNAELATLTTI